MHDQHEKGEGMAENEFVQEHIDYTTSERTKAGWKARYDFVLNYIDDDSVVLDCACGLGENTAMLAAKAKRVVGVDIDNHFIRRNAEKWPEMEFLNQDVTKGLPFPDGTFDVIISIETIEHISTEDAMEKALREFDRLLAKDGIFICSGPNREVQGAVPTSSIVRARLRRLLPFLNQQASWHTHYRHWKPEAFKTFIGKHFADVELFGQHGGEINGDVAGAPYLITVAHKKGA